MKNSDLSPLPSLERFGHDVAILHKSTPRPPPPPRYVYFNSYIHFDRPQLTSSDVDKRCLGVRLLSDVLHRLVGIPFQEKEGCTLSSFYPHPSPLSPLRGFSVNLNPLTP